MELSRVDFENVIELEGSITFPEGKTVVIYGENKAGKSNIIHALRYAFLSKVIRGGGKVSGYDELKLVSSKEIVPTDGVGRISVEFEHNGEQFEIRREIDRYRDNNKILKKEAGGSRELDFNKTIGKELKAGLLNALFAPDSAMGFNHLNEKNIDAVIRELFKEIGNAKVLAKDFKQRVERLNEEAQAKVTGIERDYSSFVSGLRDRLKETPIDLSNFETYETGNTSEKISYVAEELKGYFDTIEKPELKEWLKEMGNRAKVAEDTEGLLRKDEEIRNGFKIIKGISQDKERLSLLLTALSKIGRGSPIPQEPGRFYDEELNKRAVIFHQKLKEAQTRYSNALSLAQEERIDLKIDNPARIKSDKEKVLRLLTREFTIPDTPKVKVDLVKIDGSVHGLVPLKLMDEDPAFTKLSSEPIPDASKEQKRQYAGALMRRIENLRIICEDKDKAESFFSSEFTVRLTDLSRYSTTLMENEKAEREKISKLVDDIHEKLLLFTQERLEMPKLDHEGDLEPFLLTIGQIVARKKSGYKKEINDKLKSLGMQAGEFNTHEMDSVLWQLAEKEKGIPFYRSIWVELTRQRRNEWEDNDNEYANLAYVPAVVDGIDKTLDAILDNAFDEQEIIQGIKEVIVEINGKLTAEGLINSRIEMGEDSLQLSKTIYKDREITHPCGAERSFFSLAALTALATYFKLPVIIDEAANNLDKKNLQRFISLIKEFAASYDVQYILSIKETDDFPLDGWVQGFADDLQIYRVDYDGKKKYIKPVDLYA